MTPDQQRKFNTAFGGIFIAGGFICLAMALWFAIKPNDPAPHPVLGGTTIDLQSCRKAVQDLGFVAQLKGQDVTAHQALSDDPQAQLERASTAILVCKLPLHSFCMGQGCEQPGLSFTVRKPVELKIDAPPPEAEEAAPAAPAKTPARPAKK